MKRYLVFAGECGYENGGFKDALDQFDSIETAKNFAESLLGTFGDVLTRYEWYQIADLKTFKIVTEGKL